MTPLPPDDVHQAFFGWSHDSRKMDLIAYSFQEEPEGPVWQRKLEEHIRLQPSGTDMPTSSLTYLDLGNGTVAVLRRVASGHTPGRNNSHALIGAATTLDLRIALSLAEWQSWLTNAPSDQYLTSFTASSVAEFFGNANRLPTQAEFNEPRLSLVLPRLLDQPSLPLSIIGCPNEERLALVWGLYLAADSYLSDCGYRRRWSFSTHEVRHDDSINGLPEVVFLPAKPVGAGVVNRTIVNLNGVQPRSNNELLASQLLAALLRGTPQPVAVSARDTVLTGTAIHGSAPARTTPAPVDRQPSPRAATHQPVDRRRTDALLRATSIREFESGLVALEASAQWPGDRHTLRCELDIAAMDKAAMLVEGKARQELFDRLLTITYGPNLEDLAQSDALQHATKLVAQGQSDLLAMMVGRSAARRPTGPLRDATLDRVATGTRPATPSPTPRSASRQARRNQTLLTITIVILLLGLAFLLGYLFGRPAPAAAGAGQTPERSATPPVPPNPPSPPVAKITVLTVPEENEKVFSFVADGGALYPQAPCVQGLNSTWTCSESPQRPKTEIEPNLQAFRIPASDESQLKQLATENKPAPKGQNWKGPLPE